MAQKLKTAPLGGLMHRCWMCLEKLDPRMGCSNLDIAMENGNPLSQLMKDVAMG